MNRHTSLVERAGRRILRHVDSLATDGYSHGDSPELAATRIAHAALDACHAEEMQHVLRHLLGAMGEQPVLIFTDPLLEALISARAVLAKLGDRS